MTTTVNDFYRSITSFNILMNENTPFQYWQIYCRWMKSVPFHAKKKICSRTNHLQFSCPCMNIRDKNVMVTSRIFPVYMAPCK